MENYGFHDTKEEFDDKHFWEEQYKKWNVNNNKSYGFEDVINWSDYGYEDEEQFRDAVIKEKEELLKDNINPDDNEPLFNIAAERNVFYEGAITPEAMLRSIIAYAKNYKNYMVRVEDEEFYWNDLDVAEVALGESYHLEDKFPGINGDLEITMALKRENLDRYRSSYFEVENTLSSIEEIKEELRKESNYYLDMIDFAKNELDDLAEQVKIIIKPLEKQIQQLTDKRNELEARNELESSNPIRNFFSRGERRERDERIDKLKDEEASLKEEVASCKEKFQSKLKETQEQYKDAYPIVTFIDDTFNYRFEWNDTYYCNYFGINRDMESSSLAETYSIKSDADYDDVWDRIDICVHNLQQKALKETIEYARNPEEAVYFATQYMNNVKITSSKLQDFAKIIEQKFPEKDGYQMLLDQLQQNGWLTNPELVQELEQQPKFKIQQEPLKGMEHVENKELVMQGREL